MSYKASNLLFHCTVRPLIEILAVFFVVVRSVTVMKN